MYRTGFRTEYKIDGVWRATPYVRTKAKAEAESSKRPLLVSATHGRVVRNKDGKVMQETTYEPRF